MIIHSVQVLEQASWPGLALCIAAWCQPCGCVTGAEDQVTRERPESAGEWGQSSDGTGDRGAEGPGAQRESQISDQGGFSPWRMVLE